MSILSDLFAPKAEPLSGVDYVVTKMYDDEAIFESPKLADAVVAGCAFSIYTGVHYMIARRTVVGTEKKLTHLVNLNPSSYDFRKIGPEGVLAMKAMAHELMPGIHEKAPEPKKEGYW